MTLQDGIWDLTDQLYEELREVLNKCHELDEKMDEGGYDGFATTEEWRASLSSKEKEIMALYEDEGIEEVKIGKEHPGLHSSWYFAEEHRSRLWEKRSEICYQIAIAEAFAKMS